MSSPATAFATPAPPPYLRTPEGAAAWERVWLRAAAVPGFRRDLHESAVGALIRRYLDYQRFRSRKGAEALSARLLADMRGLARYLRLPAENADLESMLGGVL